MKTAYDVILTPIITEQALEHNELGKYAFKVAPDANKIEIKKAIEEIFKVKVLKVTTLNMDGKRKKQGRYPEGSRKAWKKAVVRLTPDSKSIEFFEGLV
ncbi:MAG: 50S ribosomal protein L23 [Oscillospiraceae bacterium]|jgi:large subunit ribosomal protein L23|nr:50S ribosomal protein L23 [Oscillospiraceae bacterium]